MKVCLFPLQLPQNPFSTLLQFSIQGCSNRVGWPHPLTHSFSANFQYISSASRCCNTERARGKSSLSENVARGKLSLSENYLAIPPTVCLNYAPSFVVLVLKKATSCTGPFALSRIFVY